MIRGRIAIVTDNGRILSSTEFNGNMNLDGYGKDVFDQMENIASEEEFRGYIKEFNEANFNYNEELIFEFDDDCFDMKNNYYEKWFSDYIYIKNLSEKPIIIHDAQDKLIELDSDITAVFYYGDFLAADRNDLEKIFFINKLKAIKETLTHDECANYSTIWNVCNDYDNTHRGVYLTDRIQEHDFVDEEILEYIVKENASDVSRLRCFIGDTYDADIYLLDGYGNLRNVKQSDFECLIDDIVYELEREIYVPMVQAGACL